MTYTGVPTNERKIKHYSAVQNKPVYYSDLREYENKIMMYTEVPRYFSLESKLSMPPLNASRCSDPNGGGIRLEDERQSAFRTPQKVEHPRLSLALRSGSKTC